MGTLVTLAVAIVILAVASRLLWPRDAKAPMPLYVGTIAGAFFVGVFAGSLAEGRDLWRTVQSAFLLGGVITVVAAISWFKVKPPGQQETPSKPEARRSRQR
jgi:hypothetical protein